MISFKLIFFVIINSNEIIYKNLSVYLKLRAKNANQIYNKSIYLLVFTINYKKTLLKQTKKVIKNLLDNIIINPNQFIKPLIILMPFNLNKFRKTKLLTYFYSHVIHKLFLKSTRIMLASIYIHTKFINIYSRLLQFK